MNWNFYLKTTETCNLNCKHCFTNGTNGPKIFWDYKKVTDWIKNFSKFENNQSGIPHFEFHGGEPFLVPVEQMNYVWENCKDLWPQTSWGVTTNLTFKLKNDIYDFISGPLKKRIGTSWDPDIRFANPRQYDLWRNNVKTLIDDGFEIKLFISVTKGTINIEPIELLEWVRDLGIQEMSLERLTKNGTANQHPEIFPTNVEQDLWFHKMHLQSKENDARGWFHNEFLENVYVKFENNFKGAGTFCRDCEEKIYTLNADGSISGCPNSAPEFNYGTINDELKSVIYNPVRINNIACERNRDPRCYNCEVFSYCGGDCHQLEWQDDVCGAPKTFMKELNKNNKIWNIKKI